MHWRLAMSKTRELPLDKINHAMRDLIIVSDELETLTLPRLTRVDGWLRIYGAKLRHVELPALLEVRGCLVVTGCPALEELRLGMLMSAGGMWLADNPRLRLIQGLASLSYVRGDLVIAKNPRLTWPVSFPRLS